jgi:hypothetical protein
MNSCVHGALHVMPTTFGPMTFYESTFATFFKSAYLKILDQGIKKTNEFTPLHLLSVNLVLATMTFGQMAESLMTH